MFFIRSSFEPLGAKKMGCFQWFLEMSIHSISSFQGLNEMRSQQIARHVVIIVVLMFLVQIMPVGQTGSTLAEQTQSRSNGRIISDGNGVATSLIGIDQNKAIVLFSHSNFTDSTFDSFVRVDANDSILTQSKDPAIAYAPNNSIAVVWSQIFQGYYRIFISTSNDESNSFSPPMLITNTATGNQTGPEIAVADDVVYVVWTELVSGRNTDIFLARSLTNGSSFDSPVRVDHSGSSNSIQGFPEIAAKGNDVCVVWHDLRDGSSFKIYGAISNDRGQTFGPAGDIIISDGQRNIEQSRPDVVFLSDGRILVLWQDRRTGDYDVRGAISIGSSSFSPSFLISDGPLGRDQSDPRLTIDSRGFVSVTWRDNRYIVGYHIFMRTSLDGVHYGVTERVDDAPMATSCFAPDIAASQNGSEFVAWSDGRTGINEVYFKAFPNLAPHVMITSPVEGAARGGPFPIIGTASDPEGSPQLMVEMQLQNSVGVNLTPWSVAPLAMDGTWQTSINSSHFANGNYRIAARSFDGLVYSSVVLVNVTFDNTRTPYVELTLTPDRIQFHPNDPMALQNVTITAEIYNIGTKNATDVLVNFSWLNDSIWQNIGNQTLANIMSGDHVTASVDWIAVQGNVTIRVQVDPLNAIAEDNKTNNTVSKIIHVEPARPDILVARSSIVISPELIYSGDNVNFSAIINNQGEKVANNFDVTFRVNGTLVATKWVVQLDPHQSMIVSSDWTATAGDHVLEVNADPSHFLDDASIANNVAETAFYVVPFERPLPELIIANGALLINPAELMVGQNVSFTAVISNLGSANATDVNVTFYLDGGVLAYRSIAEIGPTETVSTSITWLASLGAHELSIVIDPHHLVEERNTTNNVASKSFTVSPEGSLIADLAVSGSNITLSPSDPVMGSVVYINVTVRNIGNRSAENVLIIGKMDGQQVGQNKVIAYFQAHSNATISFTWFANEGEHTFQISIDPNNNITESAKDNNNASRAFLLSGPSDLTSLAIAGCFFVVAIGVVAFYFFRLRKR